MKIFGHTIYGFSVRLVLFSMLMFVGIIGYQLYQYSLLVEEAEDSLFKSWTNQNEISQYFKYCRKGILSKEERKSIKIPVSKYECARKYASTKLGDAIESAHSSLPNPPAPLKYL